MKEKYSVQILCNFYKIPRSSYYKWLKIKPKLNKENEEIKVQILNYHKLFKGILGYRRMTLWINMINNKNYNLKRIRRLMRELGVSSAIRRKKKNYLSYKPEEVFENVLNRNFTATRPNEKWLTDVTEFKIKGTLTKLYLSAIIDLYDKSIISYKMGTSNNNQLVFSTFDEAIEKNPGVQEVLFHSDRGFQYTNKQFKKKLDNHKFIRSMSRVSKCIDNGPMENFWGILKSEMYHLEDFHDITQLMNAIDEYMSFYNTLRFQAKLKGLVPVNYRNQALQLNI